MNSKDSFNFCIGPLVFKGRVSNGIIGHADRSLGPFGSGVDWAKGEPMNDATMRRMIDEGYECVKQYVDDYRAHAAKRGFPIKDD